jgi:RHS repeat-associated protein
LTAITDPSGKQTTLKHNRRGQVSSVTDQLGNTTTLGYELGEPTSLTDPLGRKARRFVDAAGRVAAVGDATGTNTVLKHDLLNRVIRIIDPLGNETDLSYDLNGNLVSRTDARDKVTTYSYDVMDRWISRTDPLLRQETYEYDGRGNLTRMTDRRGKITEFTYDPLDRRIFAGFGAVTSGGTTTYESTVEYAYDGGNRLTEADDSAWGAITRAYDGLDRLTSEATPHGALTYAYDATGRRTAMTIAGQPAISYTYDANNRLSQIAQSGSTVSIAYDDAGRRTALTLPNGVATNYAYDAAGEVISLNYKLGTEVLGDLTFAYDARVRRTSQGGSYARTMLPPAASGTYDDASQLVQWAGQTLTYDSNGNLTSDGFKTYTWNARNELTSVSGAGGFSATFEYDPFGRRTTKTVSGTTSRYLYDRLRAVQELSAGGAVTANILTGQGLDERFVRSQGATSRGYLTDVLGNTVALTDSSGFVQTQYSYEPFGQTAITGGSDTNSFQFTGRENDGLAGLYHYRARYYSPTLHRFISEDPIGFSGGDFSLYSYAWNNPISYGDPLGLRPDGGGVGGRKTPDDPSEEEESEEEENTCGSVWCWIKDGGERLKEGIEEDEEELVESIKIGSATVACWHIGTVAAEAAAVAPPSAAGVAVTGAVACGIAVAADIGLHDYYKKILGF